MRILIIEDEIKCATYLKKGLSENGCVVTIIHNGLDGLHEATSEIYNLIILDINLPALDGYSIIQAIRKLNQQLPILCLTARDGISDRVKGLELGADDYLVKPFAFSELLARVRSIQRRSHHQQTTKITVADLEIDLLQARVTRKGQRINLTAKEFLLLKFMALRTGDLLSRTIIAEQVWDVNFDSDTNVIDVAVKRLRQKIDDSHAKKLIHTIRGLGYVFEER